MNNIELRLMKGVTGLLALFTTLIVTGCGGGAGSEDKVIINGDFSMVYAQRNTNALGNPTDGVRFSPGGDLFLKDVSAPLSEPINLTSGYTQGQGDVSDPEVNYDATKVVFAMRGPSDATFNIWEYDVNARTLQRLIQDDLIAEEGNDVDPAYLPDGRIVFSSDRQKTTFQKLQEENIEPYKYLDEYEREQTIALHTLDVVTQEITQISFNQSHDRNPTVLKTGEIMYSRWDHFANRNHFPIFFANPDGTNLFVNYGAFSPGNSFLHPREMPDGKIMTTLMPLSGTNEGGAIMIIDVKNYADACDPSPGLPQNCNGQKKIQFTSKNVSFAKEFSPGGRFTTPYPLWDGTNRALVSYRPAQSSTVQGEPEHAIYMMDLTEESMRPVQVANFGSGKTLVDPIPLIPRNLSDVPIIIGDKTPNFALANEANGLGGVGMGVMNVKSVYETDFLDIMGDRVLSGALGESIPKDINGDPDIALIKDPANSEYFNRVARFVRVSRAIPTPPGIKMEAIGESEFEMQEILGYAPVEPDGSFQVKVPADMAVNIAVLDKEGRAFQTHTNWLQVRPGETRTCSGCHSPRRASAPLNQAPIAGNHPNTLPTWMPLANETMAETRVREGDAAVRDLTSDIVYQTVWTAEGVGGESSYSISYSDLDTPAPSNGRINYEDHIQPLWDKFRPDTAGGECAAVGECTCVACHSNAMLSSALSAGLNLEGGLSGVGGRIISYDQLLEGAFETDSDGVPLPPIVRNGQVIFRRAQPIVSVGGSANSSRTSHLTETIFNTKIRAGSRHTIGGPDHSQMMNAAEKRLVAEWIDVGAQYINDPFELVGGVYKVRADLVSHIGVSKQVFNSDIQPILTSQCASCHSPEGNSGEGTSIEDTNSDTDPSKGHNRFILTGNPSGDFNVTVAMINNLCDPANNDLLLRPISDGVAPNLAHPQLPIDPDDPDSATQPVLDGTSPSAAYTTILDWISMGAANNPTCS